MAVMKPMHAASHSETQPAAGVIPTKPAIAPSQAPTTVNFPLYRIMSTRTHPRMPVHPAVLVLKTATMARMLALRLEPPCRHIAVRLEY